MEPVPALPALLTLLTLLVTLLTPTDAAGAELTPEQLRSTARALGAESRLLFGFPTGSSLSLTTSLIAPIISEGPLTGKLNVTWVPVAVPLDQSSRQLEYIEGARSRADDLVDVYDQLQDAIEGFGLPGRPCLLRTLCEAAGRRGDSPLVTRVLQLLIGLPEEGQRGGAAAELTEEASQARRLGSADPSECGRTYHLCPGSLFDLLDEADLL
ncbi:uncharacterized protein LOC122386146 [Amphibalanus amphitrite]|nr:uncharacterized protein LOC122386146 [Amphibalanus amphitrite]